MTLEAAFFATAAANVVLAAAALFQMSVSRRLADNSTLPVVIPEEIEGPVSDDEGVRYSYRLRNDGKGPALNVEHGVELGGKRLSFGEEGSPFKFRTVREGEVIPPSGAGGDSDAIDPIALVAGEDHPERVYWVRYETLHGEVYEARNDYDPASNLELRRISRARRVLLRLRRRLGVGDTLGTLDWSGRRADPDD